MPDIVVIGTSLGGWQALQVLLSGVPAGYPLPLVLVQHRSEEPDNRLITLLRTATALPVCEPDDKQPIAPGSIYLAPANYHLLVEPGRFALSTEAPVVFARPSVDVLFESAAAAYGAGVVAVVLTGANADGAAGVSAIRQRGGLVVVQDPATAEARRMPDAAIAAGADHILRLLDISLLLVNLVSAL